MPIIIIILLLRLEEQSKESLRIAILACLQEVGEVDCHLVNRIIAIITVEGRIQLVFAMSDILNQSPICFAQEADLKEVGSHMKKKSSFWLKKEAKWSQASKNPRVWTAPELAVRGACTPTGNLEELEEVGVGTFWSIDCRDFKLVY